jgi:DNA-binding protein
MTTKNGKKDKLNDNNILVGNKPIMNYVLATVAEFNGKANKEVAIKARGKTIYKAVDIAEIVRNRFLHDAIVKTIKIGTEKVTNKAGRPQNVSTIEIYIKSKPAKKKTKK